MNIQPYTTGATDEEALEIDRLEKRLWDLRQKIIARDAERGVYYCAVCGHEQVFPETGEDTCPRCLRAA